MTIPSQLKERARKLRDLIDDYRYHYHVLDESIMSEAAADGLKHELAQLEEQYPELVTPDSPTQRVSGAVLDGFKKVTHRVPMISLSDVFSEDELSAWVERIRKVLPGEKFEYFCDIKMDGLACALIYEDGVLAQAVTRGDSRVGEDVTVNVKTIKNVPLSLRRGSGDSRFLLKGRTEIRGEIVIFKSDFKKLNEQRKKNGEPEFANPRNLAAGTIRQLDSSVVARRPLNFIGYDLLRNDASEVPTNELAYRLLKEVGVATSGQSRMFKELREVKNFIESMEEKRLELKFNTDGMVIKVNNRKTYDKLGVVGKSPRAAVAYKYAAEEATTVVKDIVISLGRTGAATPVAVFDSVKVAGSTVKHASLHNADEIARLDVRVGDTVVIYKAGDIIPQVKSVLLELRPEAAKKFDFDEALKEQYPELEFMRPDGEVAYRVKGATGDVILKRAMQYYASKSALDIDGLGEKNVVALVDAGLVKDIADLYLLKVSDIEKLEGFARLSAENMVSAIEESKTPQLSRFITALGIRHVGSQTAIDLAGRFKSFEAFADSTMEELEQVNGIGKVVAESIVAWFSDEDNIKLVEKLKSVGVAPTYEDTGGGKLAGMSFVVTGSLETMGREDAAEKIRSLGGVFQTSVGKGTDYLVTGKNVGASKIAKAEKLGVKVVGETEFLEMIR